MIRGVDLPNKAYTIEGRKSRVSRTIENIMVKKGVMLMIQDQIPKKVLDSRSKVRGNESSGLPGKRIKIGWAEFNKTSPKVVTRWSENWKRGTK